MESIDKKKLVTIISGIKLCSLFNGCSHSYCKNKELLFSIDDPRFDYVESVMKEHKLSYSDLERILVAYRRFFNKHDISEEELMGKIKKIYNVFELEKVQYQAFMNDVCPMI